MQVASFRRQWDVTQVRIITLDGADIGWLQSATRDGTYFLAQIFVERVTGNGAASAPRSCIV